MQKVSKSEMGWKVRIAYSAGNGVVWGEFRTGSKPIAARTYNRLAKSAIKAEVWRDGKRLFERDNMQSIPITKAAIDRLVVYEKFLDAADEAPDPRDDIPF